MRVPRIPRKVVTAWERAMWRDKQVRTRVREGYKLPGPKGRGITKGVVGGKKLACWSGNVLYGQNLRREFEEL